MRSIALLLSSHVADVGIQLTAVAIDAGLLGALPHIAVDGAAGHAVMGVPDGVLAQGVQVHPLAEPGGGSVHAGLVTQVLDFLAEGDGALGAILLAQTVGTAGAVAVRSWFCPPAPCPWVLPQCRLRN